MRYAGVGRSYLAEGSIVQVPIVTGGDHFFTALFGNKIVVHTVHFVGSGGTGGCGYGKREVTALIHHDAQNGAFSYTGASGDHNEFTFWGKVQIRSKNFYGECEQMWVYSKPSQGTLACVLLPMDKN